MNTDICSSESKKTLNRLARPAQHRLHRTKAGLLPAFDGIHTTGFFGLLAIPRQIPLLPVKPAVGHFLGFSFKHITVSKWAFPS